MFHSREDDLSLEPRPVVEPSQWQSLSNTNRSRVVVGKIGLDAPPARSKCGAQKKQDRCSRRQTSDHRTSRIGTLSPSAVPASPQVRRAGPVGCHLLVKNSSPS